MCTQHLNTFILKMVQFKNARVEANQNRKNKKLDARLSMKQAKTTAGIDNRTRRQKVQQANKTLRNLQARGLKTAAGIKDSFDKFVKSGIIEKGLGVAGDVLPVLAMA